MISSTYPPSLPNVPLFSNKGEDQCWMTYLQELTTPNPQKRIDQEVELQSLLNDGVNPPSWFLDKLQEKGYSISYNPETIARFKNFSFPNNILLQNAIRSATAETGLIIERNRMYRPGPASLSEEVRGYDKIFAIFETQTTEKTQVAEEVSGILNNFFSRLPESLQKPQYRLLDIACGNGVQTKALVEKLKFPFDIFCFDNQLGCVEKCQAALPQAKVWMHNLFSSPLISEYEKSFDVLFVSHLYMAPERIEKLREQINYYAASNSLVIFVNDYQVSDPEEITQKHPSFLRGKPSAKMLREYYDDLYINRFRIIGKNIESKLLFPPLTQEIKDFILTLKRGDYEACYPNISESTRTFKALLEFIASYPLESMSVEERKFYLEEIEEKFKQNKGPSLKTIDRLLFCVPPTAGTFFAQTIADVVDEVKKAAAPRLDIVQQKAVDLEKLFNQLRFDDLCPANARNEYVEGFFQLALSFIESKNYTNGSAILWYLKREHLHHTVYSLMPGYEDKEIEALLLYPDELSKKVELLAQKYNLPLNKLQEAFTSLQKEWNRLDHELNRLEFEFLKETGCKEPLIFGMPQGIKDQQRLEELRARWRKVPAELSDIRNVYRDITAQMKIFLAELIQECDNLLKACGLEAPCPYSFIGLGSFAREEMTPFSDLEFAILVKDSSRTNKEYFLALTTLFHFRILNLGETIIPSLQIKGLSWFYDTISPRGLSFDGSMPNACKTAYGKQDGNAGDYELIGTVEEIIKLQEFSNVSPEQKKAILNRYHLPVILSCVAHLTGSEELTEAYQEILKVRLTQEICQERALTLMLEDLDRFQFSFGKEKVGQAYEIKKDFYRFPHTMLDSLTYYYQLDAQNSYDKIDQLRAKEIISPEAADELKTLCLLTQKLRLEVYNKYGKQKGDFKITENVDDLYEIYYRFLPFQQTLTEFAQALEKGAGEKEATQILRKASFYSKTPYYQGLIDYRLMRLRNAYIHLSSVIDPPDPLLYHETLGDLQLELAKYEEAFLSYDKGIEILENCASLSEENLQEIPLNQLIPLLKDCSKRACLLKKKGDIHNALAQTSIALSLYEESEKFLEMLLSEMKIKLKQYHREEYNLCLKSILQLYPLLETLYCAFHEISSNVEYLLKARALIRERVNLQNSEALVQFNKTLKINLKVFQEEHPNIAHDYSNIGGGFSDLGNYQEALIQEKNALRGWLKVFGKKNRYTAISYNNLAGNLVKLGKHQEALVKMKKALKILSGVLEEKHPNTASIYNNFGMTLDALGNHKDASVLIRKGLEIRLDIFGENHPKTATSYNNLGLTLYKSGNDQEGIMYIKKALKIRLELFGSNHPVTSRSYNNFGHFLWKSGAPEEALVILKTVLKSYLEIFGEQHPDTGQIYNNIGCILIELGKHQEALLPLKKGLEIHVKAFGEKHPTTALIYENIAEVLDRLGHHKEALKYDIKFQQVKKEMEWMNKRTKTYPQIQTALENKQYKKILLFLLNALGSDILADGLYLTLQASKLHEDRKQQKKIDKWLESACQSLDEGVIAGISIEEREKINLYVCVMDLFLKKIKNEGKIEKKMEFYAKVLKYGFKLMSCQGVFTYDLLDVLALDEPINFLGEKVSAKMIGLYYALQGAIGLKNTPMIQSCMTHFMTLEDQSIFFTKKRNEKLYCLSED
ncbi:MAG: tetratricopeptide repeat protein [Parachlamydiaceae bacterium]|nr:tetratricopeptide repeat protein [Parachlamydiaceae bacterium]